MSRPRLPSLLSVCEAVDTMFAVFSVFASIMAAPRPLVAVSIILAAICLFFAARGIRLARWDDSKARRARIGLIVGAVGALGLLAPGMALLLAWHAGATGMLWPGVILLGAALSLCALNGLAVTLLVVERSLPDPNRP